MLNRKELRLLLDAETAIRRAKAGALRSVDVVDEGEVALIYLCLEPGFKAAANAHLLSAAVTERDACLLDAAAGAIDDAWCCGEDATAEVIDDDMELRLVFDATDRRRRHSDFALVRQAARLARQGIMPAPVLYDAMERLVRCRNREGCSQDVCFILLRVFGQDARNLGWKRDPAAFWCAWERVVRKETKR